MEDETRAETPVEAEPAAAGGLGVGPLPPELMAQLMDMPVEEWILLSLSMLGMQAVRHLGLSKQPPVLPDQHGLAQARLALEAAGGLSEATVSHLPYEDVKQIRQVLDDLHLAYAQADTLLNPDPGPAA